MSQWLMGERIGRDFLPAGDGGRRERTWRGAMGRDSVFPPSKERKGEGEAKVFHLLSAMSHSVTAASAESSALGLCVHCNPRCPGTQSRLGWPWMQGSSCLCFYVLHRLSSTHTCNWQWTVWHECWGPTPGLREHFLLFTTKLSPA